MKKVIASHYPYFGCKHVSKETLFIESVFLVVEPVRPLLVFKEGEQNVRRPGKNLQIFDEIVDC